MMGLFSFRKPRGFHHEYIYVDERKDKLEAIKRHAEAQIAQDERKQPVEERLRGVFLGATKYARRRHENRLSDSLVISTGFALILLLVLVVVWKMLMA